MLHSVEIDLGGGRTISIETGKMAKQANGAVIVRSGESVVLVTACTAPEPKPNANFFPLTVDYREKPSAAGKFPGWLRVLAGAGPGAITPPSPSMTATKR